MYDRIQGVLDEPVGEGTHFRVPWFQTPNVMDIRTRPRSISSVTGTKGELVFVAVLFFSWEAAPCEAADQGSGSQIILRQQQARQQYAAAALHMHCLTTASPACLPRSLLASPPAYKLQICRWSTSRCACYPSQMSSSCPASSG